MFDFKWLKKVDAILEYINSELSEINFNNFDFHRYSYEKKICLIDIDVPRFLEYQIDKKESLTVSQQAKLEQIPGWNWKKIIEKDWDKFILSLTEYFDDNGTSKVPAKFISSSEFKLGSKVSKVRKMYKRRNLSSEKIHQLESFTDWSWSPTDDY